MLSEYDLELIRTICAVATLIGSIIYWCSWSYRSKKLRKEIEAEIVKK